MPAAACLRPYLLLPATSSSLSQLLPQVRGREGRGTGVDSVSCFLLAETKEPEVDASTERSGATLWRLETLRVNAPALLAFGTADAPIGAARHFPHDGGRAFLTRFL